LTFDEPVPFADSQSEPNGCCEGFKMRGTA
jgi:hypothetical protein